MVEVSKQDQRFMYTKKLIVPSYLNRYCKLLLVSCIFLLSVFVPESQSQSLYQETYEIKQMLDNFSSPSLQVSSSTNWTLTFEGEPEEFNTPGTFVMEKMGRYELLYTGSTESSVKIVYQWGEDQDSLNIAAESTPIVIYHLPDVIRWDNGNGNGEIVKENFYKLMSLLGLHVAFKDTIINYKTIEKIYQKYADNPFLAGPLHKILFSYNLREVAQDMSFDLGKIQQSINSNLDKNYGWMKDLYFKSSEDYKESVLVDKDESYYQALEIDDKLSQSKLTIAAETANAAYAKVSGVNSTVIIEGLSDFIVERAQEELNIAFMDRFKQRMTNSVPNEYSTLFPKSYDLFLQFEIANYKKLLQSARPSFLSDLQNVGLNLPKLLQLEKYEGILDFSPAIYNLALFYNMSQLIYTDHTVDEILPFAFHHLADRHFDLADIVNLKVASTIDSTNLAPGFTKELNKLEGQIKDYCEKASHTYQLLTSSHNALIAEIGKIERLVEVDAKELLPGLNNAASALRDGWAPLQKLDYNIPGQKTQKVFEFYPKYALANLNGKGYFGDQLEEVNPQLQKYEGYFKERLTAKAYIARGLSLTRLLLKESFNERFEKEQGLLQQVLPKVKDTKEKALLLQKKELNNRISAIKQLRNILTTGLNAEINFWKGNKIEQETDVDLAALAYLKKVIENENKAQEIWTSIGLIESGLNGAGEFSQQQLEAIFPDFTAEKVRFYLDAADTQLDEVYYKITNRQQLLAAAYPKINAAKNGNIDSYLATKKQIGLIDPSNFAELEAVLQDLEKVEESRAALVTHYQNIDKSIQLFDKTFSRPSLAKSRDNALNLAGVLELATHLLFSFKKNTTAYTKPAVSEFTTSREEVEEVWLDKPAYEQLMGEPFTRSIYLGLLYEQLRSLNGTRNFTTEGLATISTKLINTIYEVKTGQQSIATKKKSKQKVDFQDYYPLIKSTVDLVATVIETPVFNGKALSEIEPALGSVSKISSEGLALYQNINTKQYGFAIYNAMELFRVISDAQLDREREKKRRVFTVLDKKKEQKKRARNERVRNNVILYGTLMADVLNANTSDEVKSALRAAAVPPGSSRLKRELDFNLGINSYLGIAVGEEKLLSPTSASKTTARTIGLTVPIGIAMSWKFSNLQRSSYTLFLSVLDIGAVTTYRLDDPMASALPKLEFNNFLAPGASLFYNFNKVPISMGVGWQLGPQTRKIDPLNPDITSQASRFLFSLNVDVPLFNFVNGRQSTSIKKREKMAAKQKKSK